MQMAHRYHHLHDGRQPPPLRLVPDAWSPPSLVPRAPPIPLDRIPFLENHSLAYKRSTTASSTHHASSPRKTCGPDDTSGVCERPTSDSTTRTLPIVIGAVIPITVAIIVLFFLHRRHVKRLRNEDLNDKHKSLDFGMDFVSSGGRKNNRKNKKNGAEMSMANTEKSLRRGQGLSLDMNNPYLLPPGLHGSNESLRSLSRSMHGPDDKYRPAIAFGPSGGGDNGSMRSFPAPSKRLAGMDDSSSFTAASSRYAHGDDMNQNLLQNAQTISKSPPPLPHAFSTQATSPSPPPQSIAQPLPQPMSQEQHQDQQHYQQDQDPRHQFPQTSNTYDDRSIPSPPPKAHLEDKALPSNPSQGDSHMGSFVLPKIPSPDPTPLTVPYSSTPPPSSPPRHEQYPASPPVQNAPLPPIQIESPEDKHPRRPPLPQISLTADDDQSDYGDDPMPASKGLVIPEVNVEFAEQSTDSSIGNDNNNTINRASVVPDDFYDQYLEPDMRRLTMGVRPLPPEDPTDSPEQRANRIRSFYKEYFDDSKPFHEEDYYEDYGPEAAGYGMDYSHPAPQFTQPVGRRAMTPPPRMPPRFGVGGQRDNYQHGAASAMGFAPGPGHRNFGSISSGPGPRAFSSASGRMPGAAPRKPRLPPSPLHELPTPYKLKDDAMILPIDYAPGTRLKDRRAGRPETPLGGLRPYSPAVPAHIPLASSYDDLAVMPSPHALRKSGTFTALDFAPPPKFRNMDSSSDAGSIRSNRTGASAAQYGIRTGAYRLSRLPAETVGTKEDITSGLRPKWDMSR